MDMMGIIFSLLMTALSQYRWYNYNEESESNVVNPGSGSSRI